MQVLSFTSKFNSISFHYAALAAPGQASPVGDMGLLSTSFPLLYLPPSPCQGHQLTVRVPGPRPLQMGIGPWQQTLLPVGTGLCPRQSWAAGSPALRAHTCFLSPLRGEFLQSLGEGKGLSNFDIKPKAIKKIDTFCCIKKTKNKPKLLCGRRTCCTYEVTTHLGKLPPRPRRWSPPSTESAPVKPAGRGPRTRRENRQSR